MHWSSCSRRRLPIGAATLVFAMRLLVSSQGTPSTPTPNQPSASQPPASQTAPAQPMPAPQPLLIMIDPAHGGSESGAVLNPAILEKDVTLAFARRLLQQLGTRGIQAQLVREGDGTLSTDQRAAMANSARPALYISIHATSQGTGMRIYSSMLSAGADDRGPFRDWQTAQSASLARSRSIQEQLAVSVQKTGFPIRALTAPLRPLNSVLVPALAVEIAPTTGDVSQLASADYQQMIASALANAIASARSKLEPEP